MLLARSAWAWYGRFLDTSPVTARIMAAVPILVAADSVTQLAGDKPWNWRSTIGMGLYGAIWVAPVSYYWYKLLAQKITMKSAIPRLLTTVAVDTATMSPLFIAAFLTTRGIIEKKTKEEIKEKVRSDAFTIWKYSIYFWLPVSFLNFGIVPLKFRVINMNAFSFIWNTFLVWRTKFDHAQAVSHSPHKAVIPSSNSDSKPSADLDL